MAKWTAFPHDSADYTLRRRGAEEEVGAPARRRRRAAAEGRRGAGRVGAVPRRRVPEGRRGRPEGAAAPASPWPTRRRRSTPTTSRSSEKTKLALFLRGGRARRGAGQRANRRTPTRTTGWPTRSAATARASAWPRRWRRGWAARSRTRSRPTIKLRAQARRRAHRARRLPCRGDRQGRLAARPHARAPSKDAGLKHVPAGAEAQPGLARSRWSNTPTAW